MRRIIIRTPSFRKAVRAFLRGIKSALRGHNLGTNTDYLLRPDGSQDALPLTSPGGYWHKLG